jgi:hypothetical protein
MCAWHAKRRIGQSARFVTLSGRPTSCSSQPLCDFTHPLAHACVAFTAAAFWEAIVGALTLTLMLLRCTLLTHITPTLAFSRTIRTSSCAVTSLPTSAAAPGMTDNLAQMENLDEATLLNELRIRFNRDTIYTCVLLLARIGLIVNNNNNNNNNNQTDQHQT